MALSLHCKDRKFSPSFDSIPNGFRVANLVANHAPGLQICCRSCKGREGYFLHGLVALSCGLFCGLFVGCGGFDFDH